MLAREFIRRRSGIALQANQPHKQVLLPEAEPYLEEAIFADGRTRTGRNSASFLRDLLIRRVRAGEDPDAAIREIVHGKTEGWTGFVAEIDGRAANEKRYPGLIERMRARLGADWDPIEALLVWAASNGADDMSGDPDLQNHAFFDAASDDIPIWFRSGTGSRGGFGATDIFYFNAGGEHSRAEERESELTAGYFRLLAGGKGGVLHLQSDVPRDWLLIRYQ